MVYGDICNVKKILIVDDDDDIRSFVSYNLKKEGFKVCMATNGEDGIDVARKEQPDLILLDVMMPGMDGIEACAELRALPEFKNIIIAFLSARGEDYSQVAGFEAGGDEYITKPIRPKLLVVKVKALLKRKPFAVTSTNVQVVGCIGIDREKMLVHKGKQTIQLPKKEFKLLDLLTSNVGKVFAREVIYQELWGSDVVGDRTIDVHIRKLREKIGEDCIVTLKGVGYRFNEDCLG